MIKTKRQAHILRVARHIIWTRQTVRETAKAFNLSKTSIHRDMVMILPDLDKELAIQVASVFGYHKSIRHLRGGEATKLKWSDKGMM